MFGAHQRPKSLTEIMAMAAPTPAFPCVMRLHREDPCKGWLLEIHTAWNLDDDSPLADDETTCRTGMECVQRFVDVGIAHLGNPEVRPGADIRIRLMGNSGEWAMFEFSSMDQPTLEAAISRFSEAYGQVPLR